MDVAIPDFGYKNRISIDRRFRLIHRWKATDAGAPVLGCASGCSIAAIWLHVWADTSYRSGVNEGFMERHGFVSRVHHKKLPHRHTPLRPRRFDAGKSVIRSRIEHVFADQKYRTGLFARTIGIKRAEMKTGLANLVCNIRRFLYLERINAT